MTIMASSSILPRNLFGTDVEISKEDLQSLVDSGVILKIENHKEHYAIQPCWIHDPGRGVMEEISGSVLGRWNNHLKSYVVHVENVRSNERSAAMNEDHRWLHLNIVGTFYTYTPSVGQKLNGEIKKVGNKAAICALFEVFTATVFAADETELKSWSNGDVLQFEIYAFSHRRKGPIIRAKSTQSVSVSNISMNDLENGFEEADETLALEPEYSKPKKKKKKKKREEVDDEESFEVSQDIKVESFDQNESYEEMETNHELSIDEVPSKKKKKKKKSSHGE